MSMVRCARCAREVLADNLPLHELHCGGQLGRRDGYDPPADGQCTSCPPADASSMAAANAQQVPRQAPAAVSEQALQTAPSDFWSCADCTLHNPVGASECGACGCRRPEETSSYPPTSPSTWACQRCTFESPNSQSSCEMCGAPQSDDADAPSPPRPAFHERLIQGDAQSSDSGNLAGAALPAAMGGAMLGSLLGGLSRDGSRPGRSAGNGGALLGALVGGALGLMAEQAAARPSTGSSVRVGRQTQTRHRQRPAGAGSAQFANMDIESLLQEMMQAMPAQSSGQPAEGRSVAALPTNTVDAAGLESAPAEHRACTICIQDFEVGDVQRTLPCFHRFHAACIDRWLEQDGSCPICKHRL